VLSQGDVVVVPSVWEEAFALVVREAFGARLPVIASRIGALPEVVQDGVNGLLFPPGSAEALREAMLRCATDPELFARLRQGVPPVKGMAEYVAEMESVYQEAFQAALVMAEKEPRERIQPIESQAAEEGPGTETTQSLVSIVIPAYNHAPYVAETIDSVLRQTYQNWELIIIDDGSTDATPEIIQRYSDPRIRAYRQENRGLSATLNRGIELARGQYFAFLPSDDIYEPDKLAVQVPVLEENPTVGVVFSWQTVIDTEGKLSTEQHVQEWFTVSFETKEEIFPALFERDFLSTPTHLLRMECFARVGRFDESLVTAQDYDLWLRILQYYDMRLLKRPLVKMRWHEHNQTRVVTPQTERERATVLLKAFRSLAIEEIFPSLAGLAADIYPETFARAYLTLARFVMRSGLSEMVPVACVYLTQALQYQDQLEIPEELRPLIATSPGLRRQISLGETRSKETSAGQPAFPLLTRGAADFAPMRDKNREKINVLVEVTTLDKGGVEQVVFAMVSSLPRETFRFLIVCVDGGGYTAERCRHHGIPVEVLRGDKEAAYRELLERYRADLVVTHYAHFGLPIACQMGIPVVTFVHGIYAWFRAGLLGEMGGWDQYITRYVAISQDVADYLTHRFHLPQEKVSVIPNGIDIATTLESTAEVNRADWGLRPEDYVFLNVAAISPTKGHFALLEALRRVAQTHPEVKVLCVGQVLDEEYFQRVLAKRRRDQLEDRLIFAGFHPNVSPFYRLADAFVFPSVLEGFGLAKLEAVAHGLPLILTRVGDSDKLIAHSDIGLLIPNAYAALSDLDQDSVKAHLTDESPANAADLAAAMKEFVTHREHWRTAGQRGREKVLRSFTRERALKSYEALFLREVFLDQRKRAGTEEQVENRHLRNQIGLLERVLQEKEHVVQEKDRILREKENVLQEKDHVLQEKDERITTLTRQIERQQEQLTTQRQTIDHSLYELHRLSLTIFDRLDVTKRLREFRSRLYWGARRRIPRPVKRGVKFLASWFQGLRSRRKRLVGPSTPSSSLTVPASVEAVATPYGAHVAAITRSLSRSVSSTIVKQADEILSQVPCKGIILYPPTIKWTEVLFQRPHQMLRALAAQGYLCVHGTPDPLADEVNGFRQVGERLFLCSDIAVFQAFEVPDLVLWLSRADQRVLCDFLPRALVAYDIIDAIEVFPPYCEVFQRDHERLLWEADLVTVTAEELLKEVRRIRGDALYVPNGVRLEDFARREGEEPPAEMRDLIAWGRPIIGYYGTLAHSLGDNSPGPWLDYSLIDHAARQCPDFSFVFIGPDYQGSASRLARYPNVSWLGPKSYSTLRAYASFFHVATVPFQVNNITRASCPVKIFEYLALGKPIVSTAIPECRRYSTILVAEDPEDYVRKLRDAVELGRDASYATLAAKEAAANTWEQRAQVTAARLQILQRRLGIPLG
jgi:glycosyltransferase involved in cell wall biosynthesis